MDKYIISGYKPQSMFRFFEDISKIPRGSGNEIKIADYLCAFADSRGLFFIRDEINNVFIRKPAAEEYADRPPVLLQAHSDMVCEKNSGTAHDFEKDSLDLYVDNGILRARSTTLGADDGIGVALILALLDEKTSLPELECLFTDRKSVV